MTGYIDIKNGILIFEASNEMEAYISNLVFSLTDSLTRSSVLIMLVYAIWSLSPDSWLVILFRQFIPINFCLGRIFDLSFGRYS